MVDTAFHGNGSTLSNVVVSSVAGGAAKVQWLVPDHLGTPRIILDQTGSFANVKRHDYLPFGEELLAGTGGRTLAMGYVGGDNVRQQFTEKERDVETGLDYFLARYYSSIQGRFTSIDPLSAAPHLSGAITKPQGWNGYSYSINNPLKYLDPNGLRWAQRKVSNGFTQYGWFDTDEEYNSAIDSSSETYEGWTAVTFDETKPFTITTGTSGTLSATRVELAQLNPDGDVETSVVTISPQDFLVDLGTRAVFGKSWLEGKRSFQTTIEQLINGLPSVPVAGGMFPTKPTTPNNMGTSEFGKKVMNWGTGDEAARARMATLKQNARQASKNGVESQNYFRQTSSQILNYQS